MTQWKLKELWKIDSFLYWAHADSQGKGESEERWKIFKRESKISHIFMVFKRKFVQEVAAHHENMANILLIHML